MAYTSEIEKLERRWLENPKGRNFAPLADAYRKAGELDRAIDLCRSGLEQHPDYVSAHIVYGRCLIDKKDDGEAEQVFQKVLTLDPENIIALKVLAELADRNSRFEDAVQWLTRLLNADPMNGDAAEALARAKGKASMAAKSTEPIAAPAADSASAESVQSPVPADAGPRASQAGLIDLDAALAEAPTTAMGKPEFEVERASAAHPTPSADKASPRASHGVGDLEVFDGSMDLKSVAGTAAQPDGIELAEEVELAPEAVPIEGLARTQYEGSGMFKLEASEDLPPEPQPAAEPPPPEAEEPSVPVDLPLIMPEELDQQAARRTPPPQPAPPAPPAPEPAPAAPPVRRPSAPAPIPAAVALSDDDGAADAAALSQAEPVVTETMAELYLKQGHKEDALRVYQALLQRRPDDARLREKVEELQGRSGTAADSPPAPAPRERAPAPAPVKKAAKREAGSGLSAAAFLRSVLRGQPAAIPAPAPAPPAPEPPAGEPPEDAPSTLEAAFANGPADPVPGAPTKPAGDNISLDAVFGDQVGRGSMQGLPLVSPGESTPEGKSAGGAGGGGGGAGGGGGFSFDDFFGAQPPAGGDAQDPQAAHKPRASGRTTRHSEEDGDLDQFQAWLKGLKS